MELFCYCLGEYGNTAIWRDTLLNLYIVLGVGGLVAMVNNFDDARRFAQYEDLVEVSI